MEEGDVEVGVIGQQEKMRLHWLQMGISKKECKLMLKLGKKLLLQMSIELKLSCRELLT
jgi:hypothetical protein